MMMISKKNSSECGNNVPFFPEKAFVHVTRAFFLLPGCKISPKTEKLLRGKKYYTKSVSSVFCHKFQEANRKT
jgi:hypothetical protein